MKPAERLQSSDLAREITALHGYCPASARRVHTLILDGKLPAVRGSNGRFTVLRSDLPVIAEILGVNVQRTAA